MEDFKYKDLYNLLNELSINGKNVDNDDDDVELDADDTDDYASITDDDEDMGDADADVVDTDMPEADSADDIEADLDTADTGEVDDTAAETDTTDTDEVDADVPETDSQEDVEAELDDADDGNLGDDTTDADVDDLTTDDGNEEDGLDGEGEEDLEGEGGDDMAEGEDDGSLEGDDTGLEDSGEEESQLQNMEKDLFADLTPQQLSIKNAELMQNYIDLYETLDTIFNNLNQIPKTYYNTRAIEFIADKLVELKDMVNSIITITYSTKTYVENLTVYKQCLLVLQQINTMLKGIVQKDPK